MVLCQSFLYDGEVRRLDFEVVDKHALEHAQRDAHAHEHASHDGDHGRRKNILSTALSAVSASQSSGPALQPGAREQLTSTSDISRVAVVPTVIYLRARYRPVWHCCSRTDVPTHDG
jgi:hypothetical protein